MFSQTVYSLNVAQNLFAKMSVKIAIFLGIFRAVEKG